MPLSARQHHDPSDPHAGQPLLTAGPSLEGADAALILVHGRGASAQNILSLYGELNVPRCAALAPQAAGNTWYPQSFLALLSANQPYLDSALKRLENLASDILAGGMPSERIVLLGFSQGACLALEYTARYPRRYGAVIGFTGGLIGPLGTPRTYAGKLDGTPVFLGSGDPDPHVPFARVEETRDVLTAMGAHVELKRYPGMPHTINHEELHAAGTLIERVCTPDRPNRPHR